MLARACKNILNTHISGIILDKKVVDKSKKSKPENPQTLRENTDKDIKMFIIDFLNLVFGTLKSKETACFWDQVLIRETIKTFNI